MRTVQIYVGRDVTDLDCIRVTFKIDGVSQIVDVPMTGMENDKPKYGYNIDLSQGDYLATENGKRILTESNDVFITESSVFTPSILIRWLSLLNVWVINIDVNNTMFIYQSDSNVYYPFLNDWRSDRNELEYLVTEQCRDLKYERLELFNDEKINLTLSVQNLSDISKTFTDFSQSFTVPGSVVNNKIFEHFYQNDVDGTLDYNIKRPAYIEIDFIPFRKGVVMLEKANLKNGLVDNYSISFFGQLTNLKDIFGEIKINQLDFSSISFPLTATNVLNRITNDAIDYDIRFPLIAPNRLWTYADGGINDITINANTFTYYELFPAVKVARMFDAIEDYFGVSFISDFFSDPRWTKLFMLAKNTDVIDINKITTNLSFDKQKLLFHQIVNSSAPDPAIDPTPDIKIPNSEIWVFWDPAPNVQRHEVTLTLQTISGASDYFIEVYNGSQLYQTVQGSDTNPADFTITLPNTSGLNSIFNFQIKAAQSVIIEYNITYNIVSLFGGVEVNNFAEVSCYSTTLTRTLNPANTLPDMKVADFFSAIIKQFNLTCVGIDQNTFQIEPLEDWYNDGAVIDVSKYIDSESIDVARVPLYRNISMKYQQSEAFTNRQYFAISNQEYGNTNNVFNYDSGDFTIEQPFENLLFTESVGTNPTDVAILGYHLNQNYQSYIPKPTLLYQYGAATGISPNIKMFDGVSIYYSINKYMLFGQDITVSGTKYSLNFGADNSIIHKETIQNGLFATYYFSYLSNLYNLKQRLTTYKSMLPLSILTSLRLNDRLIIRDKRYIINDVKVELTTGEATLTLYNDFRQVDLGSLIIVEEPNSSVTFTVKYRSGSQSATMFGGFMTFDSETVTWGAGDYSDKTVTAYYESLPSPIERTIFVTYSDGSEIYVRIKQV
jgi:hypothetical protein